jgi:hypothetical protein
MERREYAVLRVVAAQRCHLSMCPWVANVGESPLDSLKKSDQGKVHAIRRKLRSLLIYLGI